MCSKFFKKEFSVKKFGFGLSRRKTQVFYESEWGTNRIVFLVYRYFVTIYCLCWFIYSYATSPAQHRYRLFTRWNEFIVIVYFILACILVTYGVVIRKRNPVNEHASMKWLKGMTWLFHSLAMVGSLVVLVLYWALLAAGNENNGDPINIHVHLTIILLMVFDLFIVAFPIRLLHVIYSMILFVVYVFFTLVYHWAGDISAVYPQLDWMNAPGLAAGLSIAVAFVVTLAFHSLSFGGYSLRRYIKIKYVEKPNMIQPTKLNVVSKPAMAKNGQENIGYTHENAEEMT